MIKVELLQRQDEGIWDEFVNNHPEGRFSQTIAYKKVLEETYGYTAKYIVLKKDNQILSVLPIFYWKNILGMKNLVSMPFADYGGVLTKNINKPEADILINFVKEIINKSDVPSLKINANIDLDKQDHLLNYFVKKKNDQRAVLTLSPAKILWEDVFDRSVKKCVNAAYREGLKCEIETSLDSIGNHFYPLYLKTMKRFGTPPHSLLYFQNKLKYFNDKMKLFLVKDGGVTVAALLGFALGETVQITKTASDLRYWHKRPNDLVHWEFIKWATENNFKRFDFGPVRYENQAQYKVKWGAKLLDNYSYYLFSQKANKTKEIRSGKSPLGSKLFEKCFSKIWSYLPVGVTENFGPFIRKNIGR
ncbi:MAG: GNAT family N-acetyltransferase [Patescibacteria group bacterium]|nr:GNAT family N-acetyltransferase [Patescibacteria group bacterium]MDD5554446.1 GNAT family N-acetyltransferase [Patescibacteria group bacterium]